MWDKNKTSSLGQIQYNNSPICGIKIKLLHWGKFNTTILQIDGPIGLNKNVNIVIVIFMIIVILPTKVT
jgi:hypothetical protein